MQIEFFVERMIPVRIACTDEQIDEIIQATLNHYEQQAVLAYKITDHVKMVHATEEQKEKWREKDKLGLYDNHSYEIKN